MEENIKKREVGMKGDIKNIIFDLGGVIMDLDVGKTIEGFRCLGITNIINETGHHYTNRVFYDLEIGKISKTEFLSELTKMSDQDILPSAIGKAWNAMILGMPKERIDFLMRLKNKYRIFLLSNTNCIHQRKFLSQFKKQYGFHFNELFEKAYYSHEIGMRKPDIKTFQFVISDSGIVPIKTLFVDDSLENINHAKETGLQVFHVKNYDWLNLVENNTH
ncbi:HAD family hydrolase [Allomuricauda sp. SCSIO 65647]|uniref:HAD family hydrolase n=1 Tax=Allomuricauda sp. SCSIO 65647 TaxID=2908843 RepID=UPI001F3E7E72|nr:HAD family phosphatase [Muricauda sp. SCSIO 65647]UJH66951.1 HAD family phosphatase [Muricauda sp. SCSIO 65647]